jgi:hypothetical protein
MDELYREGDRMPGGTAAALREEARTGKPYGGDGFHDVKGTSSIKGLENVLDDQPDLSRTDRLVARAELADLSSAQESFDQAASEGRFAVGSGPGELSPARQQAASERFNSDIIENAFGENPANPGTVIGDDGSGGADGGDVSVPDF